MSFPEEEILITFEDIKILWKKHKSQLKRIAMCFGLTMLVFFGFKEPLYRATATFKQSSASQVDQSGNLKSLAQIASLGDLNRGAAALMRSQTLGRAVVEKLGLQLTVRDIGFVTKLFSNFWENLCAEVRMPRTAGADFIFSNVRYEGEEPIRLFL